MMLLVSGATVVVENACRLRVGRLYTPAERSLCLDSRVWAADNGAFSGFDADSFLVMLDRVQGHPRCLFVAAPDVVAKADETLRLFGSWEPMLHGRGFPVAFVGQDGLRLADVPWQSLEAMFLGGSTEWKLGQDARTLAGYARAKGKWVHMGRVNSLRRLRYADAIGCQSVDGSSFSKWSRRWIPWAVDGIREMERCPRLF